MNDLTLLIPAKNEPESLPSVLDELKNINCEKKVILKEDDVKTINAIKNFDVDIIYQKNYGYGDALITGINNTKTKYFCIFNADGSFNPAEINGFLKLLEINDTDFLFASRYENNSGSEDDTFITFIGNKIFSLIGKIFFKLTITDILYTFVVGKSEKAKILNLQKKDFSFCVELPIKAKKMNFSMISGNSYERKRIAGTKKVSELKDGFLILMHMIVLFFQK